MMMIHQHHHPTVEVPSPPPPWDPHFEDPIFSPQTNDYFSALKRYLPSSEFDDSVSDTESSSCDLPFDSFTCDNFRMYEFKIRKCARGRSHDWTECPYAHPGEKARRRDPRKYHYSGTACPEFRRGSCRKGDSCEFSHGVFECWLHPARYRTQPCKDGPHCKRRVCFFAHSPEQLRILPESLPTVVLPASPPSKISLRYSGYSPTSVFESFPDSPPLSPSCELANAMRGLQIGKVGPRNVSVWGSPSPRGGGGGGGYMGICSNGGGGSLPTTPTRGGVTRSGLGMVDPWEEELPMERVESGKDLRAKIYAKLSKDNSLDPQGFDSVPDFDWVSDLVN